ncbi:MAG: hypothetical protein ACTSUO_09555 [Candidatus Thorarchaeota archaeon]
MPKTFRLQLSKIQPSQLYISRSKLDIILKAFDAGTQEKLEPIPIKELNGELVSTDGHTRGLAWHMNGYSEVEVEWEDVEMDWEAYTICVEWCKQVGITSIPDLAPWIIDHDEYEIVWLERCKIMQDDLVSKRG